MKTFSNISNLSKPKKNDPWSQLKRNKQFKADSRKANQTYKYKITKQIIDEGSSGKIFKAVNMVDRSFCAVKVTDLVKVSKAGYKNEEVKILKMLDHPNIIKVYDTYKNKQYEYIFMEYCEKNLIDIIIEEEEGKLSEKEFLPLVKQILSALVHCHSKNIVHRDLKLENILLKETNEGLKIKLIDFGHS